jgi:F0F1-type ATP synthase assembly protein I
MAEAGKSGPSDHEAEEIRIGWRMAGIGMQVASEVAAGVILGWLFDYLRGRGNIGVAVGACAGIAVGLWSLIRNSLKLNKQLERTAPTAGRGKPISDKHWKQQDQENDDDWNEHDDWNTPRERQ